MKNQTLKSLNNLGRQISSAWNLESRDNFFFSKIAKEELEKNNVSKWFSKIELMNWFLETKEPPTQQSPISGFGEPPLTVYCEEDFFIEIYFWNNPLISIHDHAFSGAFTVLEGASLNCEYHFNIKRKLKNETKLGNLQLKKIEHLNPGSVREIKSGNSFIHDVWHYMYPTISLVARTKRERTSQFVYHQHMAADTLFQRSSHFHRRLSLLEHLLLIDPEEYWKKITILLEKKDLYQTFIIFCDINQDPRKFQFSRRLNRHIKQTSSDFLSPISSALKRMQTVAEVNWHEIETREARLLTSLLLINPEKKQLLDIFEEVFAKDAALYLSKATSQLRSTGAAGSLLSQIKMTKR